MSELKIKAVFTDIGGVIATNGWDTHLRERMVEHFQLEPKEIDSRHHLMFDSFERGHLTFDQYLQWTVFFESRPFTLEDLKQWIFEQGRLLPGTYEMLQRVRRSNPVKLGFISNEGGGLTQNRVEKFKLRELADFMVFSYAVGMRKPDPQIWTLALSLAQVSAADAIYIDDRKQFVDFAASLGFQAYQHTSPDETAKFLANAGLKT